MRTPDDPRLAKLALLTRLLDQAFRVPGTRWRFGIEALLGLVPGLGDSVGALLGGYGVWLARQLGAPLAVQARMLLNLAVDALAGAIPLAGDAFDLVFKAHVRNQRLLQDWLAQPHRARRTSAVLLVAGLAALLLAVAGTVWLAIASVSWLLGFVTRT
jgi:hypothetical protein